MCWFHSLCLNHFLLGNLTTAFSLCIPKGPGGPAASNINLIWEAFSCENDSPSSRATHLLIKDDLVHSPSILPKPAYWLLARSVHVTLDAPSGNFYEFWNHKKMFWTVPLGRGTSQKWCEAWANWVHHQASERSHEHEKHSFAASLKKLSLWGLLQNEPKTAKSLHSHGLQALPRDKS